ncbi:guanine nucleotide exchange factor [Anaeramoeba flamelloides]|uniref:Guanine nucleotide exchange factor n=1 Tax=Anaeramoeba flamelloides TaxID=1746091 RepID=A0AAV7ZLQ3_9EUKA|nr:guanine nucleotide exchange factor [Anaeramoeba flamelloides]
MIPEITDFLINIKNLNEDKLLKKSQSKIEKNTKYTYFNLLFGCLSEQEIDQIKAQFEKQNNINSSRNNLTENVNENNQEQEKEKEKEINNKKQKEDEERNKILLYQNYCSICSCWNYKLRESIEKSNLFLTDKIEEQEKFIKEFQNLNLEDCLLEEGDSSNDKQGNNMTKKKNPKSSSSLTGNDLESNSKTIVIAATVEWLVDYLCSESGSDSEYIQIFLLTYRSFTTATELLTLLKKKYLEKPPGSLSGKRLELYKEKISKQIKFRIFNILNQWIRFHFYDFESDPSLIEHIENFIAKVMLPDNIMSKPGKMLKAILSKMQKAEKNPILHLQLQSTQEMPKPILPKELGEISFAALDRIEFARQITLIEFDLYRKIQPKECLKQGWTKKDKDARTPNIVKLTNYFNNMSNWFANEIVSHSKLRTRIQILTKIIKLAIQARKIGNYNIIQEIIAGCNNASVYRLKKTWAGITTKIKNKYDQLVKLMERDNNYRLIRKELSTIDPPALPYIGMYLTDLVFVGEGNPDFLTSLDGRKKLINFDKRRRTSFVIREIQLYQQAPFLFQEVPKIKDFILKISNADYDEEKMYDQSLIVEPRERK